MKTSYKIMVVILLLALLAGVMAYLAGFFEAKVEGDLSPLADLPYDGRISTVEITEEPVTEQAVGTIRAKVEAVISSLITATISSISVRAGDDVKRGKALIQLDSRALAARSGQARQSVMAAGARLEQADKAYQRMRRIYQSDPGAVSKVEIDRAKEGLETARAEILRARKLEEEAGATLSYSTLNAPFSGRIVDRFAEPGDTANPGQAILRMYDPSTLRLEVNVRESVASRLKRGQHLPAKIDALDEVFEAVVDEVVPSADSGSRSFLVKVILKESSHLYPGMFGRLLIPMGLEKKIYVPSEAVTPIGQLDMVLLKTSQGLSRRYVRLGKETDDGRVQIISGLAPGDKLLVPAE